ncbi:MAG: hypothetical protein K0Q92_3013 [Steroidobacteraceae bacterium]|jgi:sarcosine oxidase subunit gamma|nr:hypothetical protein [Steroidobacteraceae bacterium]
MSAGAWVRVVTARRIGVKGPFATAVLGELGLAVPERANTWSALRGPDRDDAGDIVARLGNTEFFIEEQGEAAGVAALERQLANDIAGAYPVLREDVGLLIGGPRAADALAQVCNVDLAGADIANRTIYMALMIGVSVLALAQRSEAGVVYRIWCDPSFANFLLSELEKITHELPAGSDR